MDIIEKIDRRVEKIYEATKIKFKELDPKEIKFLKSIGITDRDVASTHEGIHGKVITVKDEMFGGPMRMNLKDIKKMKAPIRWIEVENIGF